MCDNKQNMLQQNLNLQIFLRDCKQAEILLSEQDNFLSKEDIPVTDSVLSDLTVGLFYVVVWAYCSWILLSSIFKASNSGQGFELPTSGLIVHTPTARQLFIRSDYNLFSLYWCRWRSVM